MDNNTVLLALDCGKANTKIAVSNKDNSSVNIYSEPSQVKRIDSQIEVDSKLDTIEYDGNRYIIGANNEITDMTSNGKSDFHHLTMARYAISKYVKSGSKIKVIINCPYEDGTNKDKKEAFKNFILPEGKIEIKLNGELRTYEIVSVNVLAEAVAALAYLDLDTGHDIGIIDIGGLNSTYAYFDARGVKQDEKSGFTRNGILKAAYSSVEPLSRANDTEFTIDNIHAAFKKGTVYGYEEETKEYIANALNDILKAIINDCNSKRWNFRMCDLVFIGGGSILLKDRIKEQFPKAIIADNSEYINVLGIMKLLRAKNGLTGDFPITK